MKLPAGWKRAAAALLIVAAAWFLGRSIARDWPRVRAYPWQVNLPLLLASILALTAVLAWGVVVWSLVLRRFEHARVPLPTLLRIWFLSNLARYIPGTVFQFLTAAQLSRSAGLSAAVLLTSLLMHTGFSLLAAAVISAWTLSSAFLTGAWAVAVAAAMTVLAALLVHPRVLNAALGVIPRLLKKSVIGWTGSWGDGLGLLVLSLLSWALYGGAYWMFLRALTPMGAAHLPVLAGINALSFLAGYVVLIAPGGIGFRETAMQRLLLPLLPPGVAALVSVAARLWNVSAELLGGALVLALTRGGAPDALPADPAVAPGTPGR